MADKPKNPCGKMRPVENPYEIWELNTVDGKWTWKVLKKYQTPEKEADNPYARWMCAVSSPSTFGSYDLGDTYVLDVVSNANRVS